MTAQTVPSKSSQKKLKKKPPAKQNNVITVSRKDFASVHETVRRLQGLGDSLSGIWEGIDEVVEGNGQAYSHAVYHFAFVMAGLLEDIDEKMTKLESRQEAAHV